MLPKIDTSKEEIKEFTIPNDYNYYKKFFESFDDFSIELMRFENLKDNIQVKIRQQLPKDKRNCYQIVLLYQGTILVGVYTEGGFLILIKEEKAEDAVWYETVKDSVTDRWSQFTEHLKKLHIESTDTE